MPLPIPKSRSEIASIQSARKRVAVERAMGSVFHRDRIPADIDLDRLDEPDEWARVPILDKEMLRAIPPAEFLSEFCMAPHADIAEFWRSGGSTGVPLFYPRTFEDMKYCMLSFQRVIELIGAGEDDMAHISFPLGIHPVGQMMARAAQARGVGVNWAGAGNSAPSQVQIALINQLRPTIWAGMSSYGLHLANLAEAEGIDLAAGSVKRLLCSAEQVTQAKRRKIEKIWGAELFDSFGMTEAGMMGCEGPSHDGFHIWTDMFFIEVLDPETEQPVAPGEPGTLVVTPLWTNHATPFIRWNSGDIVIYREAEDIGRPIGVFPIIKHTHRTAGFFKVRGVNMNHTDFEDFMFGNDDIADFRVELTTDDDMENITVGIEVRGQEDAGEISSVLKTEIRNTFEVSAGVEVLPRGTLAREFEQSVKAQRFVDKRT